MQQTTLRGTPWRYQKRGYWIDISSKMAHILQWDGNCEAFSGLTEGMADFVRMKAGYAGVGSRWDRGYEIT